MLRQSKNTNLKREKYLFFRDTPAPSFSLFLFFFFLHKNRDSHNPGHNACRAAAVSTPYKKIIEKRGFAGESGLRLFHFLYIYNMQKNTQNKKQNKELFKNIFKNIKPSQSRCLCGFPGSRLLPPAAGRNGADGRFAAYKSKKRGQKKGRKKYAPNKQKERKRKNKRKKSVLQIQKRRHKETWPCGRAASGRVAWREALKKYAPKTDSFHCCRG